MADLESALHYSLRVEAARASSLSGAQLAAFKCYVATLVKVRSSRCQERNCLCLLLPVCVMQTVRATVPQRSASEAWQSGVGPVSWCSVYPMAPNSAQSPSGS